MFSFLKMLKRRFLLGSGLLLFVWLMAGRIDARANGEGFQTYLPIVECANCPSPTWQEVGAGSANGGGISNQQGASNPEIAFGLAGVPYAVWSYVNDTGSEIGIRLWNGTGWAEVNPGSASGGGISNNTGWSVDPAIAISSSGVVYVAWSDDSSGQLEIYILSWNGSNWQQLGAGSASGGGISGTGAAVNPDIAVAPDDTLYAVWTDFSTGDTEIYVRSWNGSVWEEVGFGSASGGGISNNAGFSKSPAIAISPAGVPYTTWFDGSGGGSDIYVRSWNGSAWAEVGIGSATGSGISNGTATSPSVAIAADSTPYITWDDGTSGDADIFVRAWTGSAWGEIGPGSASGGGISNNPGGSYIPDIAMGADGKPFVVWADAPGSSSLTEIFVRAWDGQSWAEVGSGSANGGGISNNGGRSTDPQIEIAPDGTPYVIWTDHSSGNDEIYVLRYTR